MHHHEMASGHHHWYVCSHARPTYCNVCREALSGVTSHGLSCEGTNLIYSQQKLENMYNLNDNLFSNFLYIYDGYTQTTPFLRMVNFICSFAVCKFKAHKRCAMRASSNCKWTTLAAIGRDIMEDEDGVSIFFNTQY